MSAPRRLNRERTKRKQRFHAYSRDNSFRRMTARDMKRALELEVPDRGDS